MGEIIDLTLPMYDGFTSIPNLWPRVRLIDFIMHGGIAASRFREPCKGFEAKFLVMVDHIGTHVDAPCHYYKGAKSIAEVPVDALIGRAVLFDVSSKPPAEPVAASHLEQVSNKNGFKVEAGDIAIVRCWPKKWGMEGYFGCKGLSWSAAEWLIDKGVKAIGIDLVSIDDVEDWSRPCHLGLLKKEILIIECLTNLEKLTKTRFRFTALPLNIEGATGSPIRAIAE
jgi:kynurenine formamidase